MRQGFGARSTGCGKYQRQSGSLQRATEKDKNDHHEDGGCAADHPDPQGGSRASRELIWMAENRQLLKLTCESRPATGVMSNPAGESCSIRGRVRGRTEEQVGTEPGPLPDVEHEAGKARSLERPTRSRLVQQHRLQPAEANPDSPREGPLAVVRAARGATEYEEGSTRPPDGGPWTAESLRATYVS